MYEPGEVTLPVFMVNDTERAWRGPVHWEVRDATSAVITPDPNGFRIGLAFPDDGVLVAVPDAQGDVIESGIFDVHAAAEHSTQIGEITMPLEPGRDRTVIFRWGDETNFVHLHCPAEGASYPPGLSRAR